MTLQKGLHCILCTQLLSQAKQHKVGGKVWAFTRFEVVMYHRRLDLIEIAEGAGCLHNDGARLLLWNDFVLLQVEVQVIAFLVL